MIRIGLSPMRRAPSARHSHVCDEVIRTEASFVAYCSRHPGDEKEANEDAKRRVFLDVVERLFNFMHVILCQLSYRQSYNANYRTDVLYECDGSTGSCFVQTDQQFQYCD
jgi:hypothetical protein